MQERKCWRGSRVTTRTWTLCALGTFCMSGLALGIVSYSLSILIIIFKAYKYKYAVFITNSFNAILVHLCPHKLTERGKDHSLWQ